MSIVLYKNLAKIEISHMQLAVSKKPEFLSQIFTDASGRHFKLTFLVINVNGELKGRLISATPIAASKLYGTPGSQNSKIFCLPIFAETKKAATLYTPAYAPIVSPFHELYFVTSQPTRAPSF